MKKRYPKGMTVVNVDTTTDVVKLYDTNIVKRDWDFLEFNSGGWRTRHTLKCTNRYLQEAGINAKVFQKKGEWFVNVNNTVLRYYDGLTVSY